jgi:hypothetical protein
MAARAAAGAACAVARAVARRCGPCRVRGRLCLRIPGHRDGREGQGRQDEMQSFHDISELCFVLRFSLFGLAGLRARRRERRRIVSPGAVPTRERGKPDAREKSPDAVRRREARCAAVRAQGAEGASRFGRRPLGAAWRTPVGAVAAGHAACMRRAGAARVSAGPPEGQAGGKSEGEQQFQPAQNGIDPQKIQRDWKPGPRVLSSCAA